MLEYGWARVSPKRIPKEKKLLKKFMYQLNQTHSDSQEEFMKGILVADHLKNEHIKSKQTVQNMIGDILSAQMEKAK